MVCQSADEAIDNANRYTRNTPGMCLQYVRTWLEIPSGSGSAIEAWHNANHKFPYDRNPPRGVPLFWEGGSQGYGHITLALNNRDSDNVQMMRGTDMPRTGEVTSQALAWVELNWGQRYLGWTKDLNGILLPYVDTDTGSDWSHGKVYVERLTKGRKNSDSVARLCHRLMNHKDIPDKKKPPKQVSDYNAKIVDSVKYWQNQIWTEHDGPDDGTKFSNPQANKLFGSNYEVIEK